MAPEHKAVAAELGSPSADAVVDQLRSLGLSLYEARIYVGLLRIGAQNGNELSKTSGVPSSKVYSTVEKLIGLGIVHSITRGSTTRFVCIDHGELVARLRKQFNEPIDFLESALPAMAHFEPTELFLNVAGLGGIREACRSIIDTATDSVNISVWGEDLPVLRDSFATAVERGVRVWGMLYSDDAEIPAAGTWLRHSYEEIVGSRVGGRLIVLVADATEALIARIPRHGEASAVRSRSPVLTLIVQEYLHHDIVLQRAQINIGFEEWDRWWTANPDLRSLILGSALGRAE
ncbi:MAG: helix-turn-helix domain-containing protein [Gaiellaceae bacterium]